VKIELFISGEAVERLTEIILLVGLDGSILDANQASLDAYGYSRPEMLALNIRDIRAPETLGDVPKNMREAVEAGVRFETRHVRSNGTPFPVEVRSATVEHDGETALLSIINDITDRKRVEEALKKSEDKFRTLFEQSVVPTSMTLPTGEVNANHALCALLGYSETELADGVTWQQITHPDDVRKTADILAALVAGDLPSARFEKRYIRKDGSCVWADLSTSLRRDEDGTPLYFMTTLVDITDRKRAEEALRLLATTDELTGIANRRRFFELAEAELKRAARHQEAVAIAFIDVDRLKLVNDTSGHLAGDRALQAFVASCQECIREIDVLARMGGDEFAILMPATTVEQAHLTVERVRTALEALTTNLVGEPLSLTVSAGVVGHLGAAEDLEALLKRADRALYQAKDAGRNRCVIGDDLR
jgi:diguanylate cyclase (GGDEF)-like protein/PAS domain S-box-containing protein